MKTILLYSLSLLTFLFCLPKDAEAQDLKLQWIKGITESGSSRTTLTAVDNQKNIYIAGTFSGTVDFDPGISFSNLTSDTSIGKGTSFLAKYDEQGNFIFVHQMNISATDMIISSVGNICIVGIFSQKKDFDPGNGKAEFSSNGSNDIFFAKYDKDGNYISSFHFGGKGSDIVRDFSIDVNENIFICGNFSDTVDFNPGVGKINLISKANKNIFFAKFDNKGELIFAKSIEGTGTSNSNQEGLSISYDKQGGVCLGGRFANSSVDFDPGPSVVNYTAGNAVRGFISRYDASGNYISVKVYTLANIYHTALDKDDNLYIAGSMVDSMDMDPGPNVRMIRSKGYLDMWVAKYDANGNYVYATVFESIEINNPLEMCVDFKGNLIVTGKYRDSINLDPVNRKVVYSNSTFGEEFLVRFDAQGNINFYSTFSGSLESIAVDPKGGLILAGTFLDTVDFDFGTDNVSLTSLVKRGNFFGRYQYHSVNINNPDLYRNEMKIFGADNSIYVDFSKTKNLEARVLVMNLLGQTIAESAYNENNLMKIDLPETSGQIYIVIVYNQGKQITRKVYVY